MPHDAPDSLGPPRQVTLVLSIIDHRVHGKTSQTTTPYYLIARARETSGSLTAPAASHHTNRTDFRPLENAAPLIEAEGAVRMPRQAAQDARLEGSGSWAGPFGGQAGGWHPAHLTVHA